MRGGRDPQREASLGWGGGRRLRAPPPLPGTLRGHGAPAASSPETCSPATFSLHSRSLRPRSPRRGRPRRYRGRASGRPGARIGVPPSPCPPRSGPCPCRGAASPLGCGDKTWKTAGLGGETKG